MEQVKEIKLASDSNLALPKYNHVEVYYLYTLAGVGLEPTTPLWGAPAYETGEIPTSRPRDIKKSLSFQSVTALKDLFYLRSEQLPVNLIDYY